MINNKKTVTEAPKRKLQVSNGHYLDTDHLARIINVIQSDRARNYTLNELVEETGLPLRQIRNRISVGRVMGLFEKRSFKLSKLGELVWAYDLFLDSRATLEYLHYRAAGNYVNLVWYEVFNTLFDKLPVSTYNDWTEYFKLSLKNQYTEKSLKDHLPKELRFIMETYTDGSFGKLGLLQKDFEGRIYRVRYRNFHPLIFSAMIYDYCHREKSNLYQIDAMLHTTGSPAVVFGLDSSQLHIQIEELHDRGLLRYETTHNLDQIRLKKGFTPLEFLSAYYEEREPEANLQRETGELFE